MCKSVLFSIALFFVAPVVVATTAAADETGTIRVALNGDDERARRDERERDERERDERERDERARQEERERDEIERLRRRDRLEGEEREETERERRGDRERGDRERGDRERGDRDQPERSGRDRVSSARVESLQSHLESLIRNRDRMIDSMNQQIERVERQLHEARGGEQEHDEPHETGGISIHRRERINGETLEVRIKANSMDEAVARAREQMHEAREVLAETVRELGDDHPRAKMARHRIELLEKVFADIERMQNSAVSGNREALGGHERIRAAELEFDELRKHLGEEHPRVRAARQRIQTLRQFAERAEIPGPFRPRPVAPEVRELQQEVSRVRRELKRINEVLEEIIEDDDDEEID